MATYASRRKTSLGHLQNTKYGVLRPIREPSAANVYNVDSDCPCLCVPLTSWAVTAPMLGGAAVVQVC